MKLFTHFSANNILLQSMPFPRELSMEAYLIENQNVLILNDDDIDQVQIIASELPVKNGRTRLNTDGRIDLLALYNNEMFGIIELKKTELTKDHFLQLQDYFELRNKIFEEYQDAVKESGILNAESAKWVGILVGTGIEPTLQADIERGLIKINESIPVAAIVINRYYSKDTGQVFITTNTYFKNTQRNLDKTKYEFDGQKFGKGRLVHAIIKKYISEHPAISFSELESIFPKEIQGSLGVFDTFEKAQKILDKTQYKRFFLNNEDILTVDNTKDNKTEIAVCSQWGIGNMSKIIEIATNKCGYEIKAIQ